MNSVLSVTLMWGVVLLSGALIGVLPRVVKADCEIDAVSLYASFKKYREQVNTATTLEHLTPYFSTAFNQYYTTKLENPESSDSKTRYLTQYWDNLNTAKDIVIVYDYSLGCALGGNKNVNAGITTLQLLAVLDQPAVAGQRKVDLWTVKIHYVNEGQRWLIDSMEYGKSRSKRNYDESQIIDNFVMVR